MTVYRAVNGPRPANPSTVESIERSIAADVTFAREAALLGDADGERIHHESINKLLDIREQLVEIGHTSETKAFAHVRAALQAGADTAKVMQWEGGRWWHFETIHADEIPKDAT